MSHAYPNEFKTFLFFYEERHTIVTSILKDSMLGKLHIIKEAHRIN